MDIKEEAKIRGFTKIEEFYKYRVDLKRKLRELGVYFENDESTSSLEAKHRIN